MAGPGYATRVLRLGAFAVAALCCAPALARAQAEAEEEAETDAAPETGGGSRSPTERGEADDDEFGVVDGETSHAGVDPDTVAAAEELPEDATARPPEEPHDPPAYLSAEDQRRWRARHYDATEPSLPAIIQISGGIAAALDSSLDQALVTHRYGSSPAIAIADVTFLGRATEWFHVGGRIGGRGRGWGANDTSPAVAGGLDVLAIAMARAYLGNVVDIGAMVGVGIGWGGLSLQSGGATGFAPRVHGAAMVGFRIDRGVRFQARFAFDWFAIYDIDRYGSDLELGGPSLSLGLEVRR
jgi:hypothetical protein